MLDALHPAKWRHDGTLTFRRSCAHGVCGSDAMVINGANHAGLPGAHRGRGPTITVEPIRGLPVIKDLLVDMEPFFEQYRSVMPYLVNTSDPGYKERRQSPRTAPASTTRPSASSAPRARRRARSTGATRQYVGPAAIVNAHRFIFDSRDEAANDRLDILNERSGVWRCRTAFNCSEACPRGIKVTQAIEEVKRAILYNRVLKPLLEQLRRRAGAGSTRSSRSRCGRRPRRSGRASGGSG